MAFKRSGVRLPLAPLYLSSNNSAKGLRQIPIPNVPAYKYLSSEVIA